MRHDFANQTGVSFKLGVDWRARGLAFLRFAVFVACFVALNLALNAMLAGIQRRITVLEDHLLLAMSSLCAAVVALTAVMAKAQGRRFSDFGLGGHTGVRISFSGSPAGCSLCPFSLACWQL